MVEVLTGAESRLNNPDSRGSYFDNNFTALEGAADKGVITGCGYDAVMIDEGRNFDCRWLSLVAQLFNNHERSLLLMYEYAQSLYYREQGAELLSGKCWELGTGGGSPCFALTIAILEVS
ncbi:hypothetical protein [Aeromonas sp. Y318-1]|uniref:hypothetical protein n=1 Tax=Aeromonas TaxID=642 RepID=UPI0022E87CE2|nr:hypothetical protein [Aeromonas sp. Y318-1]